MSSQLQDALDRSLENATPFTRSLFEQDSWDAERVEQFVNSARNLTVCTTTASGEPHAAVVIAACVDGVIHFTVSDDSLLRRNLVQSSRVAFTACDRAHAVMGRGDAVPVARSLQDPELLARLAAATDADSFTPAGWDGSIYRIEIGRIFAN
jgi:Pyridoxamine 5'-phosphate oxidase